MQLVRLLPVLLSALLLAAHFSRHDFPVLIAASLGFPLLLLVRRRWAARLIQAILVVGSLEWIRTLAVLVARRRDAGEAWVRLVVILGLVAMFTLGSALVFRLPALKRRYGL